MAKARVIVYCRISDDREGEEAGVTRQSEDGLALVAGHDYWQLIGEPMVDNDISATKGDPRPCFEEIMEMVEDGRIDVVVAGPRTGSCGPARTACGSSNCSRPRVPGWSR